MWQQLETFQAGEKFSHFDGVLTGHICVGNNFITSQCTPVNQSVQRIATCIVCVKKKQKTTADAAIITLT